jgi:hypothetical protein
MTTHTKKLPLRKVRSEADKADALCFEGQCLFCMRAITTDGGMSVISGSLVPAAEYVVECNPEPEFGLDALTVAFVMCAECGPDLKADGVPTAESVQHWLPKLNKRLKWAVRKSYEANVKGKSH